MKASPQIRRGVADDVPQLVQLIDVASGYRWYYRRQAPVAIAIAVLRSLDVPLGTIRELLARNDPDATAAILERSTAIEGDRLRKPVILPRAADIPA